MRSLLKRTVRSQSLIDRCEVKNERFVYAVFIDGRTELMIAAKKQNRSHAIFARSFHIVRAEFHSIDCHKWLPAFSHHEVFF